jgi:hypothetical protein
MSLRRLAATVLTGACCLLLLVACDGKKPDSQAPDDTDQRQIPLDQALVAGLSPELTAVIERQRWLLTQSGLLPLTAIRRAALTSDFRDFGHSGTLRLLEAAASRPEYDDGLTIDESRQVAAIFNALADLPLLAVDLDFAPELERSIRSGWIRPTLLPESGWRVIIGLGPEGADADVKNAMRLVEENWPAVESLVGPYVNGYLVVRITEGMPDGLRGRAYSSMIELLPAAGRDTVIHELTHVTLAAKSEYWFVEGIASFVQAYLMNVVDGSSAPIQLIWSNSSAPGTWKHPPDTVRAWARRTSAGLPDTAGPLRRCRNRCDKPGNPFVERQLSELL